MTGETGVCKPLQLRASAVCNPPLVLQRQKNEAQMVRDGAKNVQNDI